MSDDATLLSVTVSVAPQVWLTQYRSLKPHASVTIGIPPTGLKDAHLDFATINLRKAIFAALKTEIEVLNDVHENIMEGSMDTTQLAKLCMKEIGNVTEHTTFKVTSQGGGVGKPPAQKVAVPKAGGIKKAVAKLPGSPLFVSGKGKSIHLT